MDYVTIVRSDKPINKRFTLNSEGEIVKHPARHPARSTAQTVKVSDALDMQRVIEAVNADANAYLILGYISGTEPRGDIAEGEPYGLWSAKEIEKVTGKAQSSCKIKGLNIYTRSLANFIFSSWFLFDYDVVPGMPDELIFDNPNDWLDEIKKICPGLERMIITRSNSSRVLLDGKRASTSRNVHCYVQAVDANDIERFSASLLVAAESYVFQKPSFDKETGEILAMYPWSIFDPSVFSPERQVYCGAPTVKGKGLSVASSELTVFNGRRFDTRVIETPTKDINIRFKQQTGMVLRSESNHWGFHSNTLKLDQEIVIKGGTTTLLDYWLSDEGKLRCQTPFRDSSSMAGVLNRSKSTGRPCLYDSGSRTTYWPDDDEKPSVEQWLELTTDDDKLPDRIKRIMQGIDAHGLNDMKVKQLATAIAKESVFSVKDILDTRTPKIRETGDTPELEDIMGDYNRNMGVAMYGGKAVVFYEKFDSALGCFIADSLRAPELTVIKANERAVIWKGNDREIVQPFPIWMSHPGRNTYSDVVFEPKPGIFRDGARPMPKGGVYNLYQGLGIKPKKGNCAMFKKYILDVFAAGDRTKYEYLLDWFAALVQYPHKIGLPVLIFKSGEGTGKGALSDNFLQPCFDPHFLFLDSADGVSGDFNWHQATNILTIMNEAVWGGDKADAGVYKTLFWDTVRTLQKKYAERVSMRNYCHGIIFTNNDWSAPIGMGDRRHVGFDLSTCHQNDTKFYKELEIHMKQKGGQQAFLYELLERKVEHSEMRTPPGFYSEAKETAMVSSMDPIDSWLFNWLDHGEILDNSNSRNGDNYKDMSLLLNPDDEGVERWACELVYSRRTLHESFMDYCAEHKLRTMDRSAFARRLRAKYFTVAGEKGRKGLFRNGGKVVNERTTVVAGLSTAREVFAKLSKCEFDWD